MTAGWVHPDVPADTDAYAAHIKFMAWSMIMGLMSVALVPVWFAYGEANSAVLIAQIFAAALPFFVAGYVSKTGSLANGKKLSLFVLAGFLVLSALNQPAFAAPVMIMIGVLIIEATIWRCDRPLVLGSTVVIAALASLYFSVPVSKIATGTENLLACAIVLIVYATSVAWRVRGGLNKSVGLLKQEQDRLSLLAENSSELFTRHDRNGNTLFASPAAKSMFGVSATELLNSGLFDKIHLQDRISFLKSVSDAERLNREQSCEIRIRCKGDGDKIWRKVESVCRPMPNQDGKEAEVVCVTRDISEIIDLRDALKVARETTEEFNESQRRFLATMSHELRTPLNAIIGFSDILQQGLFGEVKQERNREYIELIQESGNHLLNVVNDLLDKSRIDAGRYELLITTFPLKDVATATIKMLGPIANKSDVTVVCDIDSQLPEVSADKRACQQILINLLSNAIKFSPNDGRVKLSAKQHGRFLKIKVQDNGVGISNEFLSKIGQPFSQEQTGHSRQFEGSGLGLSVVKGLLDLHRGEMKVDSKEGVGTTVTITLPIRSPVARPVPSDNAKQLIHLDGVDATQSNSTNLVTSRVNQGDRHARVSA